MGSIKLADINKILTQSENAINNLLTRFNIFTKCEFEMLIIVLCQYMYARLNVYGSTSNTVVYMTFRNVRNALSKTEWNNYAGNLVLFRNALCHNYGDAKTEQDSYLLYAEKDTLKEFLEFLGFSIPDNSISSLLKSAEGN